MASTSPPAGSREVRNRETAAARRHLLTTRRSADVVPRVVLHLPDLDALSAVAVGPPHSATRRRIDAAHIVEEVVSSTKGPFGGGATSAGGSQGETAHQLIRLLKAPLGKFVPPWLAGGAALFGKVVVLMQQPKMALAGVLAIALQLIAILVMFVANGKNEAPTAGPNTPNNGAPVVVSAGPNDPIQTPFTVFGSAPPTPPNTLPGLDPNELPTWPSDPRNSTLAGPLPAPTGNNANLPAKLGDAAVPTPAPPRSLLPPPVSTGTTPAAPPTLAGPKPGPSLETTDAAAGKPKARLQGTIKKISRETSP